MGSVQIDIGVLTDDITYSVSPAYHTYKIAGVNAEYLRYCLECRNQDMFSRFVKFILFLNVKIPAHKVRGNIQ